MDIEQSSRLDPPPNKKEFTAPVLIIILIVIIRIVVWKIRERKGTPSETSETKELKE